jgi:DNA-binding HxlR family transcriptional regulator
MESNQIATWNVYDQNCPTRLVLDRVADKWTVLIIGKLSTQTLRFGELQREVSGISTKVLTQALRGLERDGIVNRQIYASVPPKVEYSLTPLGQTLVQLVDSMRLWAETNVEVILTARQTFDTSD